MPAFEVTGTLSTPVKVVVIARNEAEALVIGKAELADGGGIVGDATLRKESVDVVLLDGGN